MITTCKECGQEEVHEGNGMCGNCNSRLSARKRYNTKKLREYRENYRVTHKELYAKCSLKYYYENKQKRLANMKDSRKIIKKICVKCGSKDKLECHHITYNQKENIVVVLCRECHRMIHRIGGKQNETTKCIF